MNHSSDYKAGAAIRLLLNGNPPNGTSPSECGPLGGDNDGAL